MAEYSYLGAQGVQDNETVLFNEAQSSRSCYIFHRSGSGIIRLSGKTNQCRALYSVDFHGNIAVPAGGTAQAISLSLALDGEPIGITEMVVTPEEIGDFFNVSAHTRIEIPKCICGSSLSVINTSGQTIVVSNANLSVTKLA